MLRRVRFVCRNPKVGCVFRDHGGVSFHRLARTPSPRRSELHRLRPRPRAQLFHQAHRRHRALDCESSFRVPSSGSRAFRRRRDFRRSNRQRTSVARLRSLFSTPRTRRHGPRRRKNDADGRRISRRQTHSAHNPGGLAPRKRPGRGGNSRQAQRIRLRVAFWNIPRNGGNTGGLFRHASRKLVPIVADGAIRINIVLTLALLPGRIPAPPAFNLGYAIGLFAILLLSSVLFFVLIRKMLREGSRSPSGDWTGPKTDVANPSAFMAASMQGVIEKLRTQEKELARLHLLAQERAQESERLTEEVTRNMPTGLLLVNATGAISTTNPAAEEALGIRALRYRSYKDILGPESELTQMLTACIRDGKTFQRGEIEHLTSDGSVRNLGVTISPIYRGARASSKSGVAEGVANTPHAPNAPGAKDAHAQDMKISGALCLMSDLTELTALQKQIRWKENLAALGEMSAGIAHEFKNSLATISGYAQMIRSETTPGDVRESSERILEQTRALTHVVTEFLRFAKPLEICYETVPMQTVVEKVAEELHETIPQCAVEFEGTFQDLPGDEALLRQALLNLARNGAESALTASTAPRVTISGTIEELGGRKWQRICVADDGPGIPETDLPKIFLPFYTTKSEGTGLGLAVVQKVALQHGGSIEGRNRQGGGAEFLLWLPLRQDPAPSTVATRAARI